MNRWHVAAIAAITFGACLAAYLVLGKSPMDALGWGGFRTVASLVMATLGVVGVMAVWGAEVVDEA